MVGNLAFFTLRLTLRICLPISRPLLIYLAEVPSC